MAEIETDMDKIQARREELRIQISGNRAGEPARDFDQGEMEESAYARGLGDWETEPTPESRGVTIVKTEDDLRAHSAAEKFRQDLRKARPFENGTIIRWTSVAVNGSQFHYAAIYADGYWFTTSRRDTNHMQMRMTHDEILGYFSSHGYSIKDLKVAVAYEAVEL